MRVDRLQLEHFRNYEGLQAEFCPGINVIYGENAQGKTNLLEGISYLSAGRTHRTRSDRELITFGADRAKVDAEVTAKDRSYVLTAKLSLNGRKQLLRSGVKLKSAGELSGLLNTVLFCPEDLYLIREGAAVRRRFLDSAIGQLRPRYEQAAAEYRRLYEHKTRILRDWKEKPDLLDPLEDFNTRLCMTGAVLIHYRAHYVRKLREFAPEIHRDFSGGREELGIRYLTVKEIADPEAKPSELLPALMAQQERLKNAELESRSCLAGPHKDDLEVTINDISARTFGSQGQTRTAALSLKLAEREIAYHDTDEYPVLLLDDVLSELDHRRQDFVLNRITGGQVFITCCEDDRLETLKEGKAFRIHGGRILD